MITVVVVTILTIVALLAALGFIGFLFNINLDGLEDPENFKIDEEDFT